MMKRIVLIVMVAFLAGGVAMAQKACRGEKMPDPKVRAERMTERMVKEYSLNDAQKQQLFEANLAFVEKMGDKSMMRRGLNKCEEKKCCDSCTCCKANKDCKKGCKMAKKGDRKPRLTEEQHAQIKDNRIAYDAELQKIMTKDQYAAYTKNLQDRKEKKDSCNKCNRKSEK